MVLRGGFGVAYSKIGEDKLLQADGNPPSFLATDLAAAQLIYGVSSGGAYSFFGYPANPLTTITFDSNGFPVAGQFLNQATPNLAGPVPNLMTPYTYHYSLETQYDVGHNWTAALGFQGSQSRKLPRTINYQLFFPHNPLIGSIKLTQSDVNSSFNALIARISRRLSNGLDLNVNYRYSQSIDECSYDENCGDQQTFPFDQATERAPSDYDVKHSLTGYVLYELPFFKSRHNVLYTMAGGWKLSGIVTLNSGFPWTPVYSGSACIQVASRGNVCPVRPIAYAGGAGTDYSRRVAIFRMEDWPILPLHLTRARIPSRHGRASAAIRSEDRAIRELICLSARGSLYPEYLSWAKTRGSRSKPTLSIYSTNSTFRRSRLIARAPTSQTPSLDKRREPFPAVPSN